jgi:hypothetical protein
MVPGINRVGGGSIAMAGSAQPSRIVGNHAVVYQLRQTHGRVLALRCFLQETIDPAIPERYRGLANDAALRNLKNAPYSPFVPDLVYLADGITFPAADFRSIHLPLVVMSWVQGPTLLAAVDRACRMADRLTLQLFADQWLYAVGLLADGAISHGNLTADNALARPGEGIAFVDYDTMTWPGSPPVRSRERQPGYDHPRGIATRPERRDDFAALVIYVSLRLLAAYPDLRNEFGDLGTKFGGVLLFSDKDLANPDRSTLFNQLRAIADPELQALIGILRSACLAHVDDVPFFRETVGAARHVARTAPGPRAEEQLDPRERQRQATHLNALLMNGDLEAARRFWASSDLVNDAEAIAEFEPRLGGRAPKIKRREQRPPEPIRERPILPDLELAPVPRPAPPRVEPGAPVSPSPRPVSSVERLQTALQAGDASLVKEIWPDVKGLPEASLLAPGVGELIARDANATILKAIERRDDPAVLAEVRNAELAGIPLSVTARKAARRAERRAAVRQRLESALKRDDRETLSMLGLSGDLESIGRVPEDSIARIQRAIEWPLLINALESDDDRTIVDTFDPEIFGGASGLTDAQRQRIDLAQRRTRWLDQVRRAIRERDIPTMRLAIEQAPEGGIERLSKVEHQRIQRAITQRQAVSKLADAMHSRNDVAIVDAINEGESAGATLPDDLDWQAVRSVVDRLSLAAAIRRAALSEPPDHARLARLLPAARDASGGETPYLGTTLDFVQLEQDVKRGAARARLREAIARRDEVAIVAAAVPDLYGMIPTLDAREQAIVKQAIENQRGGDPLKKSEREAARAQTK